MLCHEYENMHGVYITFISLYYWVVMFSWFDLTAGGHKDRIDGAGEGRPEGSGG